MCKTVKHKEISFPTSVLSASGSKGQDNPSQLFQAPPAHKNSQQDMDCKTAVVNLKYIDFILSEIFKDGRVYFNPGPNPPGMIHNLKAGWLATSHLPDKKQVFIALVLGCNKRSTTQPLKFKEIFIRYKVSGGVFK